MLRPDLPDPARWGRSGPLVPRGAGARHAVWRCEDLVIKSTNRAEPALRWLAPVHARARAAGLIVPEPVPALSGLLVSGGWTAERFLPGPGASARDLQELAPRIEAFHRLSRGVPPRPGVPGMAALLREGRGGDVTLWAMPRRLAQVIRAAFVAVASEPAGLVHGDLNPGNVILTPNGPALVDWDESRADHLFLDLAPLGVRQSVRQRRAALAYEVACCWSLEPERARRLARRLIPSAGSGRIP